MKIKKSKKQNKNTLGVLTMVGTLFSNSACSGKIYEPKVPAKLRK